VGDHCGNHAAAVAYYSLLSIGPFLLIVARLLGATLPGEDATVAAVARVSEFLPPEVGEMLPRLAEDLRSGSGLVVVALPVLLWLASIAFSALEVSVNIAFGTTPRRRFVLSRLKAFAAVSIAAVLLVISLGAQHLAIRLDEYREGFGLPPALGPRAVWISYLFLLLVPFAAFTLFYKALPRGRVAWRVAGSSALVALVLWEAARRVFGAALVHSPTFGLLTGTLAGLVSFLLWNYTAVAIALYGAEVAAILNGNRR
jgi:membrane protein